MKGVLVRLLDQWQAAIATLTDGECCFLPYDFSDQATGWVRCEAAGDKLRLRQGWADIEGYSIYPTDVGDLVTTLNRHFPYGLRT